jgi:vancomycin permeability regulator SanA
MLFLRKSMRYLRWPLRLGLAWFVLHTAFILWDGFTDDEVKNGLAVVLGNKVHSDGRVSDRLQRRLDKTVQLWEEGQVSEIFVSGGIGKEGQPEGTVMAQYLVDRGIPKGAVRVDDAGNTTWLTALHVAENFPEYQDREVIAVSQYYHISRCKLALRRMGFKNVGGAHAGFAWEWRDLWSVLREFPGCYVYLLRTLENPA